MSQLKAIDQWSLSRYREWVESTNEVLTPWCIALMKSVDDGNDVAQEALFRAMQKGVDYYEQDSDGKEFRDLSFGIAKKVRLEVFKKRRRERTIDYIDLTSDESWSSYNSDEIDILLKCIQELRGVLREYVKLRVFGRLTYEQIAKRLNRDAGHVGRSFRSAETSLRECMERNGVTEDAI